MSVLPMLVVLGQRTAIEVMEAIEATACTQFGAIERLVFDEKQFANVEVPRLNNLTSEVFYHVGIATGELRGQVVEACEAAGWSPFTVVHPSAVVSPSARLEPGVFVGPLAVISSYAEVGAHSIIHIHASIGHDAKIGRLAAIMPGARISGNVTLGQGVLIGSNAFVAAGKSIGDDCRIDALSYVGQDIPANHIYSPRFPRPIPRAKGEVG